MTKGMELMRKNFMLLLLVLSLGLTACAGDGDEPADDPTAPATGDDADAGETVAITAVEYAFEDVPPTIASGTELTIDNQGTEPHEITLFFISEEEERSAAELLALPEGEAPVEFRGVAVQLSDGSEPFTPEGPVVVEEPGRYALVCFLPVGVTDAQLQEAIQAQEEGAEGPPPLPDGPPHFTEGMWAEFQVE